MTVNRAVATSFRSGIAVRILHPAAIFNRDRARAISAHIEITGVIPGRSRAADRGRAAAAGTAGGRPHIAPFVVQLSALLECQRLRRGISEREIGAFLIPTGTRPT